MMRKQAVCLKSSPGKLKPFYLVLAGFFLIAGCSQSSTYYPGPDEDWQHQAPESLGLNPARLEKAMIFAKNSETSAPSDLRQLLKSRSSGPYDELVGPVKDRGDINGLVIKNGYIVYEFGDTRRVDMTFSVTKSFLSTTAALALDDGLIKNLQDPVENYVTDGNFDGPRHSRITWQHLLQQTSEWEGTLWDKPDLADRRKGRDRELREPGAFWEYNDVRVNLAALALLHVWQKPLPQVLKEKVMDAIGATDTWQWHGYRNSDVVINEQTMKSVSGGGHWGGGMWISARDMARFGYLFLRRGKWKDKQIFSESWVDAITTPCDVQPTYGYMWWLNTGGQLWKDVPETSYAALGGGSNIIWIYPEHDMVVVVRWIDRAKVNEFLQKISSAVETETT